MNLKVYGLNYKIKVSSKMKSSKCDNFGERFFLFIYFNLSKSTTKIR